MLSLTHGRQVENAQPELAALGWLACPSRARFTKLLRRFISHCYHHISCIYCCIWSRSILSAHHLQRVAHRQSTLAPRQHAATWRVTCSVQRQSLTTRRQRARIYGPHHLTSPHANPFNVAIIVNCFDTFPTELWDHRRYGCSYSSLSACAIARLVVFET